MSGKGLMNFYNGDKYSGEFINSSMTGYGCYTYFDSTKLIGHFDEGMCNRHAKKIYKDGRIYIGEFKNDIEDGKGLLIDGDKRIKGIWKDAVLIEELVQKDVNYEDNYALTQYSYLNKGKKKDEDPVILPSELNAKTQVKRERTISPQKGEVAAISAIDAQSEVDSQDDKKFDEQVFNKLKEVLVINYLSGEKYMGELQGGNRHGMGIFIYKNGDKVMGEWQENFLVKNGNKHPMEAKCGLLVPLSVSKYEGRAAGPVKH